MVGLIAGAAPPVAVLEGAERIGIKLTHVYGLTEVYGPASVCAEQPGWDELPADQRAQLKRRQGVPYPLEEAVTVLDPETMREVPRDGETIGEVMFRGNIVMKGYLKNEKATRKPLPAAGFIPATSACSTRVAMSSSRTVPRTSSFPAARTSLPSRSRTSSTSIPPCCLRPWWQSPIRNGAKCPAPSSN